MWLAEKRENIEDGGRVVGDDYGQSDGAHAATEHPSGYAHFGDVAGLFVHRGSTITLPLSYGI